MMDLSEMQFELLPSLDASEGQGFGIGLDISVDDEGFDPGETNWATQTTTSTRRGHRQAGRDVPAPPTWSWSMHVNTQDTKTAVDALERLATAWRAEGVRDTPGAYVPLRYRLAGRTRRIYGRPGRWAAPPSNRILSGYVPITADFEPVDSFTYADVADSVRIDLAPGNQGGFIFPTVFPVSTLPPGVAAATQYAQVGGTAKAYPVIRFEGPWEDPTLISDHWTLALRGTLGAGQYLDIDTRPWAMSAMLNGTTPAPEFFRRRTYLEDIYLRPGAARFDLGGYSVLGGAGCTVRWHSAFNSI